ncbi:hypothetical protein PAL_GLEAN10010384 [Pteropus alecto]|uniref:Uncharacterized protein n=1 Tax=Pteropus alecto TaxID=9402 RepID=L5KM64_PTEAL|nr:hypothetical protein PAL_GLEAN10010384 [Pteropus alecto]
MNETPVPATGVHGGAKSRASNWPINAFARPPRPDSLRPRGNPGTRGAKRPRSVRMLQTGDGPVSLSRGAQGADLKGWLADEGEPHLSSPTCFPCRVEGSLCLTSPPTRRPYRAREKDSNRNRSEASGRK